MKTVPNGPTMMSEEKQLQKLLAKADRVFEKGSAGPISLREAEKDIRSLIQRIRKLQKLPSPHKRKERSHRLFAELAVAHAIRCRCDQSGVARIWSLQKLLAPNGVQVRANSKRENLYVRLTKPGCHDREYHRYGLALNGAYLERLPPSEFFRELCAAGGMTRFIDSH